MKDPLDAVRRWSGPQGVLEARSQADQDFSLLLVPSAATGASVEAEAVAVESPERPAAVRIDGAFRCSFARGTGAGGPAVIGVCRTGTEAAGRRDVIAQ